MSNPVSHSISTSVQGQKIKSITIHGGPYSRTYKMLKKMDEEGTLPQDGKITSWTLLHDKAKEKLTPKNCSNLDCSQLGKYKAAFQHVAEDRVETAKLMQANPGFGAIQGLISASDADEFPIEKLISNVGVPMYEGYQKHSRACAKQKECNEENRKKAAVIEDMKNTVVATVEYVQTVREETPISSSSHRIEPKIPKNNRDKRNTSQNPNRLVNSESPPLSLNEQNQNHIYFGNNNRIFNGRERRCVEVDEHQEEIPQPLSTPQISFPRSLSQSRSIRPVIEQNLGNGLSAELVNSESSPLSLHEQNQNSIYFGNNNRTFNEHERRCVEVDEHQEEIPQPLSTPQISFRGTLSQPRSIRPVIEQNLGNGLSVEIEPRSLNNTSININQPGNFGSTSVGGNLVPSDIRRSTLMIENRVDNASFGITAPIGDLKNSQIEVGFQLDDENYGAVQFNASKPLKRDIILSGQIDGCGGSISINLKKQRTSADITMPINGVPVRIRGKFDLRKFKRIQVKSSIPTKYFIPFASQLGINTPDIPLLSLKMKNVCKSTKKIGKKAGKIGKSVEKGVKRLLGKKKKKKTREEKRKEQERQDREFLKRNLRQIICEPQKVQFNRYSEVVSNLQSHAEQLPELDVSGIINQSKELTVVMQDSINQISDSINHIESNLHDLELLSPGHDSFISTLNSYECQVDQVLDEMRNVSNSMSENQNKSDELDQSIDRLVQNSNVIANTIRREFSRQSD